MIKVTNPTDTALSCQYRGVVYSLEAGETKTILSEAALYWKTMIHAFLVLEEVTDETVAVATPQAVAPVETPEDVAPTAEEVVEEPVEEVVETSKKSKK